MNDHRITKLDPECYDAALHEANRARVFGLGQEAQMQAAITTYVRLLAEKIRQANITRRSC